MASYIDLGLFREDPSVESPLKVVREDDTIIEIYSTGVKLLKGFSCNGNDINGKISLSGAVPTSTTDADGEVTQSDVRGLVNQIRALLITYGLAE